MTTYIVTRHRGAIEWIREHLDLRETEVQLIEHLEQPCFGPGDRVMGVLPLAAAAKVCEQGAELHVIDVETPPAWRGREMSAADLTALGARLVRYDVRQLSGN